MNKLWTFRFRQLFDGFLNSPPLFSNIFRDFVDFKCGFYASCLDFFVKPQDVGENGFWQDNLWAARKKWRIWICIANRRGVHCAPARRFCCDFAPPSRALRVPAPQEFGRFAERSRPFPTIRRSELCSPAWLSFWAVRRRISFRIVLFWGVLRSFASLRMTYLGL